MDFGTYVKFANKWPVCCLATVDGAQPHVRTFSMWFADTDGFYFSTNTIKAIYRQLLANPKVALCFYAPPKKPPSIDEVSPNLGTLMRVTGTAEFIDDTALKERLLTERPFLRPSAENVAMFQVKNGEAWFWTFSDSKRESAIERVRF